MDSNCSPDGYGRIKFYCKSHSIGTKQKYRLSIIDNIPLCISPSGNPDQNSYPNAAGSRRALTDGLPTQLAPAPASSIDYNFQTKIGYALKLYIFLSNGRLTMILNAAIMFVGFLLFLSTSL